MGFVNRGVVWWMIKGAHFRCHAGQTPEVQDESRTLDHLLKTPKCPVTLSGCRLGYGPGPMLVVSPSTLANAGYGLFALTTFMPGHIVTLYDGVVVDKLSVGPVHKLEENAFTHACSIKGTEYRILGLKFVTRGRGLGSFANHSKFNNAKLQVKRGRVRYYNDIACPFLDRYTVIVAKDRILPGDEIFVKYDATTLARLGIPD